MDRKNCTHSTDSFVMLVVRWCTRCSGWQVRRVGGASGSGSAYSSPELLESHFLPVEETSPDELQALVQRAFRNAQEWEQDLRDSRSLPFE